MAETEQPLQVDSAVLQAWANENGVRPEALRALRETVEEQAVERQKKTTWDRVKTCLGWLFFGGALAAGGAAIGYTVKQASDAVIPAAEEAGQEIYNQRMELVKERFAALEKCSGDLLMKLLSFMIAVKDNVTSIAGLENSVIHMWNGIWADTKDYFTSGDTSPDKTVDQIKNLVSSDPKLNETWTQVETSFTALKVAKENFEALEKDLPPNDKDTAVFWKHYKEEFWNEMLQKSDALKTSTSSPAPESQE